MKTYELSSVLEFQEQKKVPNDTYGFDSKWELAFPITRGNIKGTKYYRRGATEEPVTTHVITTRVHPDIKRGQRIHSDGINYTIHGIKIIEHHRQKYYEFMCEQEEVLI